jgi:hypothetical protein
MRMREQTQFVAFWEDMDEPKPKFLNNFRIRPQGIKNADKRAATLIGFNFRGGGNEEPC